MSQDKRTTIENVEACNFKGKWLRDMDRQELLEVIVWAMNDRREKHERIMDLHPLVRKVEALHAEAAIKYRTTYDDYAAQNPGPAAPKES